MSFVLKHATEKEAIIWDEIVRRDTLSNFFDTYGWCTSLRAASKNIRPFPLFVEINEEKVGIIPLCLRKFSFIHRLDSLPFSDYGGGPLFRKNDCLFFRDVIPKLLEIGKQNRCSEITIRRSFFNDLIQQRMIDVPLTVEAAQCTFVLPLEGGCETIFSNIKRKDPGRTRYIKQAEKKGGVVREAENLNDLQEYYQIHLATMKRLQSFPFPFEFFEYLWHRFRSRGEMKIFLADHENKTVAGLLIFIYKQVIHAWGGASLSEYWKLRPTELLIWHTIKWGVEHEMKIFDFGSTQNDPSSGHYRFKEDWGGEKRTLYNYHILLQPKRYALFKRCGQFLNRARGALSAR